MRDEGTNERREAVKGPSSSVHPSSLIPHPSRDPVWVRWLLTALAVLALTVLVIVPVVSVFVEAFARGPGEYWANLWNSETGAAVRLTLVVAPAAVALNTVFGVAAAWAIARF